MTMSIKALLGHRDMRDMKATERYIRVIGSRSKSTLQYRERSDRMPHSNKSNAGRDERRLSERPATVGGRRSYRHDSSASFDLIPNSVSLRFR